MKSPESIYDVVVIGGGPAGMMAAATAAEGGAQVLLLEKNATLGKKLSITGGGRCNVTNQKPVVREMLSAYESAGKFLFSTFMQHGVAETIFWFKERGVDFKEENEGRLFPVTESAMTIVDTLVRELKACGVKVESKQIVESVRYDSQTRLFTVRTKASSYVARACVVATGGYARPETGSTGDGFKWLAAFGHTIKPYDDALVPVALKTKWPLALSGRTLEAVRVSVYAEGKKQAQREGRVLLTHFGLSGPTILNLSKKIADFLSYSSVTLKLDLFPRIEAGELKVLLQTWLQSNKKLENALSEVLPRELIKAILSELSISGDTPCHSVRSEDRKRLVQFLKAIPLEVSHLLGSDKAVISSGGVALEEIDFRTMSSRFIPHLYIVGDLLNINRPSGGYSLQLCWSTGYVAGKAIGDRRS